MPQHLVKDVFRPALQKQHWAPVLPYLMNIGDEVKDSKNGMITTVCWSTEDRVDYAFEGVIVTCGATIEWLKNELGLFETADKQKRWQLRLRITTAFT